VHKQKVTTINIMVASSIRWIPACMLLDSGLRDYEIKLVRGFSAEKTFSSSSFLQISLWAADWKRALIVLKMLLKIVQSGKSIWIPNWDPYRFP
jgi:hypothetical protein